MLHLYGFRGTFEYRLLIIFMYDDNQNSLESYLLSLLFKNNDILYSFFDGFSHFIDFIDTSRRHVYGTFRQSHFNFRGRYQYG